MQITKHFLPGHAPLLHCTCNVDEPTQLFPPLLGAGLLQRRERVNVPKPHDTEHALFAQDPQFP